MLHRRTRLTTGLAVAATAILLSAPAAHAVSGSEADASAATIAIAGQGAQSGSAAATFDGQQETRTGNTTPTIPSGGFIGLGVLTQQATAGDGTSASCGGVAGNGGGTIQIGEGSCITPGNTVNGSLTNLRVGTVTDAIPGLPADLQAALALVSGPVDTAIGQVLDPLNQQLGNLGLQMRFSSIEGRCTYAGGTASGTANIADAELVLTGLGQTVPVLALTPTNPDPNTKLFTNLSSVVDTVATAAENQLTQGLNGALTPVAANLVAPLKTAIVSGIRDNIEQQLAPLEQNLLQVTLNEQTRNGGRLDVTALHAQVLPVAQQQLGASAIDIKLGSAGCGPAAARVIDPTQAPTPTADPTEPPRGGPRVPTAVSAGQAGQPADGPGILPYAALAMGATAAGAAGVSAMRRRSALRG